MWLGMSKNNNNYYYYISGTIEGQSLQITRKDMEKPMGFFLFFYVIKDTRKNALLGH